MQIQWYPGHMHKASKEIKEIMPHIDLIIEVLDARIPFSSQNPMLAALRGTTPCIKLLNKSDLADPEQTLRWQQFLEQEQGVKTMTSTIDGADKIRQLPALCHKLLPAKEAGDRLLHALIMGIPNVGKSTLINILANRTIAKTGNEPAITKMLQRIDIGDNIILMDSPGMLWPNLENKNTGYRLAVTGAIKDTAIQHDDVAFFAIEYLLGHYPQLLQARYQLPEVPDSEQSFITHVGRKRGCLIAGGKVDQDKVAKLVLAELRAGMLGKITLESPEMMVQELAELAIIRVEKEAQKKLRKQRWKATR
ncbi:MAG: ribosome biogenesis GTPase YlqF [Methylovulum sp.]|jgi:ribosome biogenesis GTPase A|nr:ribosome biogenesis GTPase YlqF [Methylovulum sp.]